MSEPSKSDRPDLPWTEASRAITIAGIQAKEEYNRKNQGADPKVLDILADYTTGEGYSSPPPGGYYVLQRVAMAYEMAEEIMPELAILYCFTQPREAYASQKKSLEELDEAIFEFVMLIKDFKELKKALNWARGETAELETEEPAPKPVAKESGTSAETKDAQTGC
jgi:hypothetical protein